jgi:hypothetical protein
MPEDEEFYTNTDEEVGSPIQYEVVYKTPDEINLEKIKLLADISSYYIIDENKTTVISSDGAIYMNLFDEGELHQIKQKILEIVNKL